MNVSQREVDATLKNLPKFHPARRIIHVLWTEHCTTALKRSMCWLFAIAAFSFGYGFCFYFS